MMLLFRVTIRKHSILERYWCAWIDNRHHHRLLNCIVYSDHISICFSNKFSTLDNPDFVKSAITDSVTRGLTLESTNILFVMYPLTVSDKLNNERR